MARPEIESKTKQIGSSTSRDGTAENFFASDLAPQTHTCAHITAGRLNRASK